MRPGMIVGPLLLIALGVLFLINNFVTDISFRRVFELWPLVLIVIGIVNFVSAAAGDPRRSWGHLSGGVILTTLGTLFAFQQWTHIDFGSTWPVLLIAIGGLGLLRAVLGPPSPGRPFRGGFPR